MVELKVITKVDMHEVVGIVIRRINIKNVGVRKHDYLLIADYDLVVMEIFISVAIMVIILISVITTLAV